jgi:hypothetical protein
MVSNLVNEKQKYTSYCVADSILQSKAYDFEGGSKKKLLLVSSPEWQNPLSYALPATVSLFPFKEEIVKGMEFAIIKEEGNTTRDKANI